MHRSAAFSILVIVAGSSSCTLRDDTHDHRVIHTPDGDVVCAGPHADYVCPRATRGFEITPAPIDTTHKSPDDIIRIGYGSYLVNATSDCASCHNGPAGFLAGGTPFPVDHAGHLVWARNLTPDARTGMTLGEDQFVEAMRTGRDFHAGAPGMLLVMPWPVLRWMSDGDLRAIYAYLRAVPAVSNVVPQDVKAGLGLSPAIAFSGAYEEGEVDRRLPPDDGALVANLERGLAIQPLAQPRVIAEPGPFARGSYLANSLSACGECHTQGPPGGWPGRDRTFALQTDHYMTGGNVFIVPPPLRPVLHQTRTMATNLTGATEGFFHEPGVSFALFWLIVVTHSHADEVPPRPLGFPMPAPMYQHMVLEDLRAIFVYAKTVTPNRTADARTQDHARWCATRADCDAGETCHIDPAPDIGNECVGKGCAVDADCDACQTCAGGACVAPAADSACIANAI